MTTFIGWDFGENKDRGDARPPHAIAITRPGAGAIIPSVKSLLPGVRFLGFPKLLQFLRKESVLPLEPGLSMAPSVGPSPRDLAAPTISAGSILPGPVVFVEQSVDRGLAAKVALLCDLRLVDEMQVRKLLRVMKEQTGAAVQSVIAVSAPSDSRDDDLAACAILQVGLEAWRATNGELPRRLELLPDWLVCISEAWRTYRDADQFSTRMKLRLDRHRDLAMIRFITDVEVVKAEAKRRLDASLASPEAVGRVPSGLVIPRDIFKDIRGFGPVATALFLSVRPWRFKTLTRWRKYTGFYEHNGDTRYNHDIQGRMHLVMEGVIKAKDPVYYPLYVRVKAQMAKEHPDWPPHRCDGKARNRVKTRIVEEVWRRLHEVTV